MKTLKDFTKEQAIELVKLAYPNKDHVKSDYEFIYQPYDYSHYSDAVEYICVKFEGITYANEIDTYRFYIFTELNISLQATRTNTKNKIGGVIPENRKELHLGSFPARNQYQIFLKLIEWGYRPYEAPYEDKRLFSEVAEKIDNWNQIILKCINKTEHILPHFLEEYNQSILLLTYLKNDTLTKKVFDSLTHNNKWLVWEYLDVTWRCGGCKDIILDKPERCQPFHGTVIECDECGFILTERTGGGMGDPFNWIFY